MFQSRGLALNKQVVNRTQCEYSLDIKCLNLCIKWLQSRNVRRKESWTAASSLTNDSDDFCAVLKS